MFGGVYELNGDSIQNKSEIQLLIIGSTHRDKRSRTKLARTVDTRLQFDCK